MEKHKLEILRIEYSQTQSGAYTLVLSEVNGKRRLPIIIGGYEAQSIAIELEKMKPARPLTHDLFRNFAETYGIKIIEVIIDKFVDNVFYSKLIAYDGKREQEIDARTSDAVALALRFACPIFVSATVLDAVGISPEEVEKQDINENKQDEAEDDPLPSTDFASMSLEELEQMLNDAIVEEDYEKASRIRDELKKRQSK